MKIIIIPLSFPSKHIFYFLQVLMNTLLYWSQIYLLVVEINNTSIYRAIINREIFVILYGFCYNLCIFINFLNTCATIQNDK